MTHAKSISASPKLASCHIVDEDAYATRFVITRLEKTGKGAMIHPVERHLIQLKTATGELLTDTLAALSRSKVARLLDEAQCGTLEKMEELTAGVNSVTYKVSVKEHSTLFVVQIRYIGSVDSMANLLKLLKDDGRIPVAESCNVSLFPDLRLPIRITQFVDGEKLSTVLHLLNPTQRLNVVRQTAKIWATLWSLHIADLKNVHIGEAVISLSPSALTIHEHRLDNLRGPLCSVSDYSSAWIRRRWASIGDWASTATPHARKRLTRIERFVQYGLSQMSPEIDPHNMLVERDKNTCILSLSNNTIDIHYALGSINIRLDVALICSKDKVRRAVSILRPNTNVQNCTSCQIACFQ